MAKPKRRQAQEAASAAVMSKRSGNTRALRVKHAVAAPEAPRRADDEPIIALPLEEAPLSPAMAPYFAKCEEKLGFVPNVLRIFALRPKHLLGWWRYYDELLRGESGLSRAQREAIAVVVSRANDCHY